MWSSPGEKDPTILTGALQRAGQGWPWMCISAGCLPLLNLLPSPPLPGVGSQGCSLKPPACYNPPWSWLPGKPSLGHQDVSLAPQEMWWKLSVVNTWGMRPGLNTGSGRSARATQGTRRSEGPTRPGRTGPRAKGTARVRVSQRCRERRGAVAQRQRSVTDSKGQREQSRMTQRTRKNKGMHPIPRTLQLCSDHHSFSRLFPPLEDSPTALSISRLDSNSPGLIGKFQKLFWDPGFSYLLALGSSAHSFPPYSHKMAARAPGTTSPPKQEGKV